VSYCGDAEIALCWREIATFRRLALDDGEILDDVCMLGVSDAGDMCSADEARACKENGKSAERVLMNTNETRNSTVFLHWDTSKIQIQDNSHSMLRQVQAD